MAKVEREGEESRLILDIALDELKSSDLDVASAKFGGTIFNLLNMWQKGALRAGESLLLKRYRKAMTMKWRV